MLIPENPTTPCHHDRIRSENDIHCPSSFELPMNTPEPTEPAYATRRGDEPVDVLTTETPNTTSSDEVRYIDTEQWLDELCAELSETSNKPPDDTSSASQQKPDRLACFCGGELRLFGKFYQCLRCDSPRIAACRYCEKVLQLTSDSHAECVGCGLPYTFDRARRRMCSRTLMPSEGGEVAMFGHEFRGHSEQISWDDGTEFVATTRVRRPVVVSNRSHAVIFLPIYLAPLLPSLVFTNERENGQPENGTDDGFVGFAGFK